MISSSCAPLEWALEREFRCDCPDPELDQLFGAYLHQDYQLFGNTIQEVVECYKRDSSSEQIHHMLDEIARFRAEHSEDLDSSLLARYGNDFDPRLWEHTAASFFQLLESMLRDGLCARQT
jgi:CdiI immunity protein